jgi:membrane-bound ClpP family serine protease
MGGGDSDIDHDFDVDADVDADIDHDFDKDFDGEIVTMDGETGAWLPFLSMRFWTFGLASFGATGALLELAGRTSLGSPPPALTTMVSIGLGVIVGWITAWTFRKLKKDSVSGDVGMRQVKGSEATILLSVSGSKPGKIRALVDGQSVDLLARSLDEGLIERGEKVLVVDLHDGTALVTRLRQLPESS